MNIALILAGGTGKRMGSEVPKQLLPIDNIPIIIRTICVFENNNKIDYIVLVSNQDYINEVEVLVNLYNIKKVIKIIKGGSTRHESSLKGILSIKDIISNNDIVLLHDAARPFVTNEIINHNIQVAASDGACVTAVSIEDSLIDKKSEYINQYIDRKDVLIVQTPQSIRGNIIKELYEYKEFEKNDYTDDGSFLMDIGFKIRIVNGSKNNFKITTNYDLKLAEYLLMQEKYL